MKVVRLEAENFKRLKAVDITPDSAVVVISGKNAQGKSSVLDAIFMALSQSSAKKSASEPVRQGAETARITLDLGEIVVSRVITAEKNVLTVKGADGSKFSSPQQMLDELVGKLSFDPESFANQLDAKKQLDTLLQVVDLPFKPADIEAKKAEIYAERTVLGRSMRQAEAEVAMFVDDGEARTEELSASKLVAELQQSEQKIAEYEALFSRVDRNKKLREEAEQKIAALKNELALLDSAISADTSAIEEFGYDVYSDAEVLRQQLADIDQTNASIRAARQRQAAEQAAEQTRSEYNGLTKALEDLEHFKAEALAKVKMPIEGLSFSDSEVLYKGVPLSQASGAERLRVSVAMGMALNPTIRVMRITNGSLLDQDNFAMLEEMAAEHDFQLWVERVSDDSSVGVVIEDGLQV